MIKKILVSLVLIFTGALLTLSDSIAVPYREGIDSNGRLSVVVINAPLAGLCWQFTQEYRDDELWGGGHLTRNMIVLSDQCRTSQSGF